MTQPPFSTSDAEVAKLWAMDAYYDTIADKSLVGMLINRGVLHNRQDLTKSAGDQITFPFVGRIQDFGFTNNETITGLEKRPNLYSDTIKLYELNQVSKAETKGTISAQMTSFGDLAEVCSDTNKMWLQERVAVGVMNQLTGNTTTSFTWDGLTHNTTSKLLQVNAGATPTAPTSGRIHRPNAQTTDQGVNGDTTATLKLTDILELERIAATTRVYVPPLSSDGVKYLFLTHPDTFTDLMEDASSSHQMRDIILAQITSGRKKDFTAGQSFVYSQTEIRVTDKCPRGVHSSTSAEQTNTRRSVFLGQNAGTIAFGKGFSVGSEAAPGFGVYTDEIEVGRIRRYRTGLVYAAVKNVFNSVDYSTIVLTNYVAQ